MSVVQFPDAIDPSADLQIWNNAAFDNGEISEDLTGSRQSWGSLKSLFGNPKASFDSVSGKENQGPVVENQIPTLKSSSTPLKTVNGCEITGKSKIKVSSKKGFEEDTVLRDIRDEKKIDEEIEEVESEIVRLKSKLAGLRLEKTEKGVKVVEKRGRAVAAKFMDQKQSVKNGDEKKAIEEFSNLNSRSKVNRRGISLGPAEIISGGRRGMSMGPAEIFGAIKSRQSGKQDSMITPLQSRRKSCFWKLQDIEEEKEKVKSSSVSPKSRKLAAKNQITSRQAVTTIGSRKGLKKDEAVISSIQPKKLFKEGEKSAIKKPVRPGRVVPSRYNQGTTQASSVRKRSLPENDNDNSKRDEKKRSMSAGKSRAYENVGTESRVKKRWEIPSEIVVHGSVEGEKSPMSILAVPDLLPRLRIIRGVKGSPRDSGPAKKVAELIGRKTFFSSDEDVEESVCQELTYPDNEGEEN